MSKGEEISEQSRAEDLLLGAMGYDEDASLDLVVLRGEEIELRGHYRSDKNNFTTHFDVEVGELEQWALEILKKVGKVKAG